MNNILYVVLICNIIQPAEGLDNYLASVAQSNRRTNRTQPYIVCCASAYYIACDGKALLVSPPKFATALADLIAVYYAFNTVYPKQLDNFFHFMEVYVFEMKTKLPARAVTLLSDLLKD
jgi:hypothetical protein